MIGKYNPLNIRYSYINHWMGQTGQTNGFCNFTSYVFGIRAAAYLLMRSYRRAGFRTYAELITRFAPSSENSTEKYIDFVCSGLHVMPFDVPETGKQFAGMIHRMWRFEQGCVPDWSAESIYHVINHYGLKPYGLE